jgi:hypothetical protein
VAEFLSPAWIEELDQAGITVDGGPAFRLDQIVTGAPGGDVRYRVTIADGSLRVGLVDLDAPDADATLTTSFATAVELATGRRDASDVFAAGLVRFRGDLEMLQAATSTLTAVAAGLVSVRSRTTFPPGGGDGGH